MKSGMLLLAEGHVTHARAGAGANRFRYPVLYLMFAVHEEHRLREELRGKFRGFYSVRREDYLRGGDDGFAAGVKSFLRSECGYEAEEVWLQTLPRMLGYGFNPVSFWWCRRAGTLEGVLCEVNNTFGERHFYWVRFTAERPAGSWIEAKKVFHVSPFFPVDGSYRFRFAASESEFRVDINYHGPDGELRLGTCLHGTFSPLASATLPRLVFRYGWMTPMVMARIHFQAIRLFLKRARFYRKPHRPIQEVTS